MILFCLQALIGSESPKIGSKVDVWWTAQSQWYRGVVIEHHEDEKYLIFYDDDETHLEDFKVRMWRLPAEQMIYTDLSYAFAQCIQNCDDKMHGLKVFPRFKAGELSPSDKSMAFEDVPKTFGR